MPIRVTFIGGARLPRIHSVESALKQNTVEVVDHGLIAAILGQVLGDGFGGLTDDGGNALNLRLMLHDRVKHLAGTWQVFRSGVSSIVERHQEPHQCAFPSGRNSCVFENTANVVHVCLVGCTHTACRIAQNITRATRCKRGANDAATADLIGVHCNDRIHGTIKCVKGGVSFHRLATHEPAEPIAYSALELLPRRIRLTVNVDIAHVTPEHRVAHTFGQQLSHI